MSGLDDSSSSSSSSSTTALKSFHNDSASLTKSHDIQSAVADTSTTLLPMDLPSNRFELELEFLQCLASPAYLHHLATSGLFADPAFTSFLKYLSYWKRPEYARFITYPHCLYFLDLLTSDSSSEAFVREMANVGFRNFVHEQQFYSWQFRSRQLYGSGLHGLNSNDIDVRVESGDAEGNKTKEENDVEAVGGERGT